MQTSLLSDKIRWTYISYNNNIRKYWANFRSLLRFNKKLSESPYIRVGFTDKIMTAYEGYYYKRIWPAINYGFLYFTRFKFHALRFSFFLCEFSFTNIHDHRTAGEGRGLFFNSLLPVPPASQTLINETARK